MKVHAGTITPELAQAYLKKNRNIRKASRTWVEALANTMRRGEFETTPDGIVFDEDGFLVNGQHRLMAIVLTGLPQEMLVYTDMTDAEVRAQDRGRKRSLSDVLGRDKKVVEVLAFAARVCLGTNQFPDGIVDELYGSAVGATMEALLDACRSTAKVFSSTPVKLAAVTSILDGADEQEVAAIYRALVHGDVATMPPVAAAFTRQVYTGVAVLSNQNDLLSRAMDVFDPAKRNQTRIIVRDTGQARQRVRDIIGPFVSRGSDEVQP